MVASVVQIQGQQQAIVNYLKEHGYIGYLTDLQAEKISTYWIDIGKTNQPKPSPP